MLVHPISYSGANSVHSALSGMMGIFQNQLVGSGGDADFVAVLEFTGAPQKIKIMIFIVRTITVTQ